MSGSDQEFSLSAMLPTKEAEQLCNALAILLDAPLALIDLNDTVLGGTQGLASGEATEIIVKTEPIGHLVAPQAAPGKRAAAAALIRQILLARTRQRVATDVHGAAVEAAHTELQREKSAREALQEKHRTLAAEFERRLAAQAKITDERQRQLYQAERLASVGQLAAGIAHEINNPIGFARSNLSTGQKYLERLAALASAIKSLPGVPRLWADAEADFLIEDFHDLIKDSIVGIDRVARIVADLKGYSNVDKPEEEFADPNSILASACSIAESDLKSGGQIIRNFAKLQPMLCLPGHLAQAYASIINNAILAIADRGSEGQIRVSTMREADFVKIRIADNGKGIPPDALKRVFDPFFTTRPVGKGTGLGLTVARDIMRAHGGDIALESVVGEGTTVTVALPE